MEIDQIKMGRRIAERRRELGWDQPRLVAEIKKVNPSLTTTVSTISSIERGKSRNPTTISEIAVALGVNELWLKTETPPKIRTAPAIIDSDVMDVVFALVAGSYEALGLPPQSAAELAAFLRELSKEPLTGSAAADPLLAGKILAAAAVQKFLRSRRG